MKGFKDFINWAVKDEDDEFEDEEFDDINSLIDEKQEKEENLFSTFKETKKSKVVEMKNMSTPQYEVVVVKPKKFENAIEIAESLKKGVTVAINFEHIDDPVSTRILDFLSGATYALDATITKVSTTSCIITPHSINVVKELVDELESTGIL